MCKNCQYCLESCYWHLIEKRFCYDESIALYDVPEKKEYNNNTFDNMAFYDSVSVIAGRSIVTIDPLPPKENKPIVHQPRRLRWEEDRIVAISRKNSKSDPAISADRITDVVDMNPKSESNKDSSSENTDNEIELRRKTLLERRMSKSLYLKLDQPKEIPIIRQQSVPKFFLDTPQEPFYRAPSTTLTSPVPTSSSGFKFDLYTVVKIEQQRQMTEKDSTPTPIKDERSSRLFHIKEKIKLKRAKSALGAITSLPHSHHI